MKRINPPTRFTNLKAERMWSLEFAQEKFPEEPFHYFVLLKVAENSYETHGVSDTATEAFKLRRELVGETGQTKFFIRAKRKPVIDKGFNDSNEDTFRDALQSGDTSFIAEKDLPEFNAWASRVIQERPAYARVNRDEPRWSNR